VSDRESGVGAFFLGIALGAVLGLVFAPGPGDETRSKLARRMRNLRDLAEEKVDDVRALVAGDEDEAADEGDEAADEAVEPAEEVRRRLGEARRRRRGTRAAHRASSSEEDEPVA
jgi:gas vesicle protein